jgi:hypothetical protein
MQPRESKFLCSEDGVLQGTFETLTLPDVLGLLAHSNKTGTLWLEAGAATAAIYLDEGRCCAAQSGELTGPVSNGQALLSRVVELCFAAVRQDDGSFRFGNEQPPWTCEETIELDAAIDELARLVDEWRDIQETIPSLDARVRLTEDLHVEELVVDRERWALLVSVDGRRTVRELVRKTNRQTIDVCHAIIALVEAGAVSVAQPVSKARNAATATHNGAEKSKTQPKPKVVRPEEPYGPGVETPHPEAPTTTLPRAITSGRSRRSKAAKDAGRESGRELLLFNGSSSSHGRAVPVRAGKFPD